MRVSWSQANTFKQCAKRWAFGKLDKIVGEPSEALQHGIEVHTEIENALNGYKAGELPTFMPSYMQKVLMVIDDLHEEWEVEKWLEKTYGKMTITGKADIATPKTIIDWKTGKRPKGFKDSVVNQLHLYAFMLDFKPGYTLIASYPEHDVRYRTKYNPERGEAVSTSIIKTGEQIAEVYESFDSASQIQGTPDFLCKYCEYEPICEDSFSKRRKVLRK